ncbi:MAG: hypothetical protein BGN85_05580 [Alphaproteobacteria bacterium 64-11]|nr:hypothetical protein [Alphaproteobacteria bacterium]OJU11670.1 MAG: hypothetical protein BGN85_05580 [Alphaproteobacteria bacterium 64-11]
MSEGLLFLHLLLFMFSFAFTGGLGIYLQRIARTGDAGAIHAAFRAANPLSKAGGIGWILTGVVGGALAQAYGYDPAAPWLLCTYAIFAVLLLNGFLLHLPWQRRVLAAAPGPELDAALAAPIHKIASAVSAVSVLALIFLMTARPG